MPTEERQFLGAHGHVIRYDVTTPDRDPRGVVVIVHGLGEHGRRYGHVVDALTGAGFVVAVPDHLGHGRSDGKRLRINSFADYTGDIGTVLDAVRIEGLPTFLLGHSMGGCIALDFALDHQERLTGLVLSGPAVVPGSDMPPILVTLAPILGRIVPGLPSKALRAASISRDPKVVADYDADPLVVRSPIPAGLGGAMISTMQSFPKRLPSLRIPLLVMHGGKDVLAEPDGSRMVEKLAGSSDKTLIIYDELFHEIFNEPERDTVIATAVDWLSAHADAAHGS
ncbi:alpha/beta fold hydrolase [Gordonia amarae]|uniref:Monoacylglycerol lipase n=2 Tax=Gordonia amarae TaxID=36821 RepID=G7GVW1_9ACTN|nr:alpha/beta hydrolase [Gordonia amarae]MCS3878814.1 alpha-beta hydrolase superfamily lysophospholipase [Gordonia amarae]QHN17385.1 alpha/beta fold hydrolase [Gordonia amarae]QHN21911.1 alpha/beta fold hydrolase [Gordonia amarae]QHN30760.1 alpha/beta fold hydrolase [Gordonia amarae]QHN39537.1 alpha/beta fold hydrolase [Gordonia amarae]